ncbi:YggS family pyridoxal phosphate-dependent enzyme [Candidatus Woesearchaeota archaeon]|nr:YggS family pyridoxal phosphate-dependent enzyme [Candidatus Woesearchaeota archaeon]
MINKMFDIPNTVTLVAVSKTRTVSEIISVYEKGVRNFGENYIQEGISKIKELSSYDITWHFIGHLQSNKVKLAVEYFDVIQTVDSIKIASLINKYSTTVKKILIQVRTDIDKKSGCPINELEHLLEFCSSCKKLDVLGFMCIPSENNNNLEFKQMHSLFLKFKDKYHLSVLSMGMSADYLDAISCGSNMVRLGTKIFGKRK